MSLSLSNANARQGLALTASVMITMAIGHGYGRHYQYLSRANQILALKYYTGFQCLLIVATGVGRAAFSLYLLNILRQQRFVWFLLWVIFVLQIIINIVSVVTVLAQCKNINSIWDTTVVTTCWDPNVDRIYAYVQCSINTVTDLFLAVFPTYTFWSLSLQTRIKISLVILMSLGLVAMVASIMRIVYVDSIAERGDQTAATVALSRWALAECYLVIVTASIPCIRSLLIASVRIIHSNNRSRGQSLPKISAPIPDQAAYSTWTVAHPSQSRRPGSVEYILSNAELDRLEGGRILKREDVMLITNDSSSTEGRAYRP
ncbi:hypothetical protein BO78DRAFT_316966 [Aspergillus sclerotiicarbonarius CBS 121057]|uniref:Rhodopsin domain-containing protein n=1 Tax=Aspergillus sclerotiicarbonarius (strain CBS 121057 / IBT 28362) TaxID=1448318 RepID=A0A319E6V9_ASPSB|nr:hypothetical protein BO78DRAFT_316966 [Aspergillus sclerotiicarbonarius CBS 121057]